MKNSAIATEDFSDAAARKHFRALADHYVIGQFIARKVIPSAITKRLS